MVTLPREMAYLLTSIGEEQELGYRPFYLTRSLPLRCRPLGLFQVEGTWLILRAKKHSS